MTDRRLTRRECFGVLAAAAVFPPLHATRPRRAPAPATAGQADARRVHDPHARRSPTPATSTGTTSRAKRDSSIESGAHGIVWPQGSSSVANLTKDERMRGLEVLAKANQGRKAALVLGVQGRNTAEMLEYARRAEALAPDAMIAMPPSAAQSLDEYREYFRALAQVTRRPVFVQTSGGAKDLAPPVELIVELAREFPHVAYVKEESAPLDRADEGGAPSAPADQGRVRRFVRRRLAVRDAARPRRRHDRAWRCMPT